MVDSIQLEGLNARQLRELALGLFQELASKGEELVSKDRELHAKQTKIDQLAHEMAQLKRWKYAARSEQLHGEQRSLLEETIESDLEAIEQELAQLKPAAPRAAPKEQPRRARPPEHLPRIEIRHEPEHTRCGCGNELKRIGEDISERLDYTPGVFSVERHVRGKWACACCERLIQAPVPAHVIDKGLPSAGLLAQVLVAKYSDHLPLYRQEKIFERAGVAIARSTLAQWVGACGVQLQPLVDALRADVLAHRVLHADETPVAMLDPGKKKTHRAYLWSYCPGAFETMKAVIYDFAESRSARHAEAFLGRNGEPTQGWRGTLVCDDYVGYKGLFAQGVIEAGCLAHARRKFFDLWTNHKSPIAQKALEYFGGLYDIERELRGLPADEREQQRQLQARPLADALHAWLLAQRERVPDGTAIAKALDYNLKRWNALTRYLGDGALPADNNWIENQIRPIAIGRANWMFAGSLRAGKRAAAVMSLVQSAKLNGHDPFVYLKDVLTRLPTQKASRIGELLPHRWNSNAAGFAAAA
jgi:transposase